MIELKNVLKSITMPFKDMEVDKVYAQLRPKSVPAKMNSFVVVSLPVTIYDKVEGEGYDLANTFMRVEIFVRRDSNEVEIPTISKLASEARKRFPISDGRVLATKPRVLLDGDDNNGFSVVTIQATLTIY